jgi:hypothetical protein
VERDEEPPHSPGRGRATRIARSVVYWVAVLVISIAILVGLILLLESRDESSVGDARAYFSSTDLSRPNAITR